jgi:hypothetical protein
MIFIVNEAVIGLSGAPDNGAPHAGTVIEGDVVEKIADAENAGWMKVRVFPEKEREGFLPTHALNPVPSPSADIDREQFFVAATLAAQVFGVDDQYLYAVAAAQSGVKNIQSPVPGSEVFGPFQFSVARWADLIGRFGAEENITADDRSDPFKQMVLAARYSSALIVSLKTMLGRDPLLNQLYLAQLLGEDGGRAVLTAVPPTSIDTALKTKLDVPTVLKLVADNPQILQRGGQSATVSQAVDAAAAALQPGLNEAAQLGALLTPPRGAVAGKLDLSTIDRGRDMAQKIIDAFANAGFNEIKQATAVAIAKHESGLNPIKINRLGEHSVGLFQLNTEGSGRGHGHTDAQLQDPDAKIQIAIAAALNPRDPFGRNFAAAKTLEQSVNTFVIDFENPKDKPTEIADVLRIARQLLA